jgi:porin
VPNVLRPTGLILPLLKTLLVLAAGGLTPAGHAEPPAPPAKDSAPPPAADPPSLNRLLAVPGWVDLDLNLQAQPLGNPSGGSAQKGVWMQQLTLGATFSSGLSKPTDQWHEGDHWQTNLQLMLFSGDPQLNAAIGAAYPLQSTAHPTGLWLTEASLERRAGRGELAVKAGVFSLNPGFVSTPVLDQYVHSALNDTLNFSMEGLPINPYIAPGVELHWKPGGAGRYGEWRYAAFWIDAEQDLASLFGVNPDQGLSRGHLQILQWSTSRLPGAQAMEAPIQHRGESIDRQLPPPQLQLGGGYLDNLSSGNTNSALYGTLTLAPPLPLGLDNRLWLGVNSAVSGETNPVPLFLGGGWLSQGLLPGRPLDVLALGYGRSSFNSQLNPGLSAEAVLELNYTVTLNANLSLQPVLQWVINPGGSGQLNDILAAGLQLQLQF